MIAKLVSPHGNKNFSFQAVRVGAEAQGKIVAAFCHETVKAAHPFLQGSSSGWIMVEFWNPDDDKILAAAEYLAQVIGVPLLSGDFTRDEIF